MPLPVYHLRRWLAAIALLFIATIAGMYFYARQRERNVLKEVPNKLGIEIKQTAAGFEFSKSDGKRTQFKVQAGSVKQFKLDGSAELHNVSIILYGRDSSRFDQIYGDDFSYDKKSGDIIAHGDVQIDLEANSAGLTGPDQGAPKELKNPIHLKTRDLVFNQNSGDAFTKSRVDFRTAQASGWAVGVRYEGKSNALTLSSDVHINISGREQSTIYATYGVVTREPRVIVLDHPRLERAAGIVQSQEARFFLGRDNNVQRVVARGDVTAETTQPNQEPLRARADEGEMLLTGSRNLLRTATLTGNVHVERRGLQPMQADAGRAVLDFVGKSLLEKIHAMDGVRLTQHAAQTTLENAGNPADATPPQNFDITAPAIDFFVADGQRLDHAVTLGAPAQITISPAQTENAKSDTPAQQRTVITAKSFEAKFAENADGSSRLTSVHGAPDAKIVNINPGIPDRVSTSQTLDASFLPQGGISSIVQQGVVAYTDNQPPEKRTQAWAEKATYTPADRLLVLTGNPRVSDGSMVTTAITVRINRNTDDAFADGNVKSTYNDVKEQPNGALLASSSPIHVTSASMVAHNSTAIAIYSGNARLWQDANIIEAPSIQFNRNQRTLLAQGTAAQPVATVLVQGKLGEQNAPPPRASKPPSKKEGKASAKSEENPGDNPIAITAARLTYADADRKAHYEGGVIAKGSNFTASANTMDVYLLPRSNATSAQQLAGPGRLDKMIAQGNVHIVQPDRRAQGQQLVYTASDDKFVLTGGPPSIFDAEHGKITGVSLTFFRADDRVLVEGEASTPVVTQTRVAQ